MRDDASARGGGRCRFLSMRPLPLCLHEALAHKSSHSSRASQIVFEPIIQILAFQHLAGGL
jgi:hypothetical protein